MGKNTTWHHYATVIYGYTFIKSSMDSDWSLAIIFWGFTIPTTQSVRNILRNRYNIHVGYTDLPAGIKWDTYICILCIIEIMYWVVEIIVQKIDANFEENITNPCIQLFKAFTTPLSQYLNWRHPCKN